jgi:hypothetical protein
VRRPATGDGESVDVTHSSQAGSALVRLALTTDELPRLAADGAAVTEGLWGSGPDSGPVSP